METIRSIVDWAKPALMWIIGMVLNIPNATNLNQYLPEFMIWGEGMDVAIERGAALIGLVVLAFTARLMYIRGKKEKLEVKMLERKANENHFTATNEKIAEQQKQIEALRELVKKK